MALGGSRAKDNKYYEDSFDYLIIMDQLRLTCYLVYRMVCSLPDTDLQNLLNSYTLTLPQDNCDRSLIMPVRTCQNHICTALCRYRYYDTTGLRHGLRVFKLVVQIVLSSSNIQLSYKSPFQLPFKLSSSSTSHLTFIKPQLLDKLNSFKHPLPLLTSISILFNFDNNSDFNVELQHRFNVNSDLRQLNSISRYNLNLTYYWLSCTSLHHSPLF